MCLGWMWTINDITIQRCCAYFYERDKYFRLSIFVGWWSLFKFFIFFCLYFAELCTDNLHLAENIRIDFRIHRRISVQSSASLLPVFIFFFYCSKRINKIRIKTDFVFVYKHNLTHGIYAATTGCLNSFEILASPIYARTKKLHVLLGWMRNIRLKTCSAQMIYKQNILFSVIKIYI